MSVTDTSGKVLASFTGCEGAEINLVPGNYNYEYTLVASGALALNDSITTETTYSVRAFQPLLLWDDNSGAHSGKVVDLTNSTMIAMIQADGGAYSVTDNPSYLSLIHI